MAMKRIRVCDECGETANLSRCTVTVDGRRRSLDLCELHVKPFAELVASGGPKRGEIKVVSMDEVAIRRRS